MTDSSHLLATVNLVLGGLVFLLGFVILRENPHQRQPRPFEHAVLGGLGAVLAALTLLVPGKAQGAGCSRTCAYVWELFFPTAFLLASVFPKSARSRSPMHVPGGDESPNFILIVYAPHTFHFLLVW
jgi:hypothetical protein